MPSIDAASLKLEALIAYDKMMIECALTVKNIAPLAVSIWTDVLKELDRRGKVRLVGGSYDDVGNAIIQRLG
jgi:hypothetical protein